MVKKRGRRKAASHEGNQLPNAVSARLALSHELGAFALLSLVALSLRLPFVFPAVIDWDESTFVLVGQSWLQGDLPYVELWALKPPLAFAFYAVVIAIFGRDLVAVRLAGTLCVVVSAFLIYLTGTRLWNRRVGLVAAILCVATVSLLPSGQATMSEHVTLVPLTLALWLLVRNEPSARTSFIAGVLLCAATLVRLNIAYVAVLVGLYLVIVRVAREPVKAVQSAAAYAAGGGLVVALTWLPYFLIGEQELWWTSVVAAPFNYASGESSLFANLRTYSRVAFGSVFMAFVTLGGAGGVAVLGRRWRTRAPERHGIAVLMLFMAGVAVGILTSGDAFGHHLIQLAPFAALLAASCLQFVGFIGPAAMVLIAVLMAGSMKSVAAEYGAAMSRARANKGLRYGAAYDIAAYLKRENPSGRPVFLLTDHIAYWLADSRPPTRMTTHPSNIAEPSLIEAVVGKDASTSEELRRVFRQRPEFVIMTERIWYLPRGPRQLLDSILRDEYVLVTQIQGRNIYRVKPSS